MAQEDQDNPRNAPSQPNARKDPFVGRVFNERFRIIELVARGGLGAVYKAEQAPLGRTCAIKILQPRYEGTTPDEFSKRFFLEASIASRLSHPNNITLYDYGRTRDDIYFMAMELLQGMTLGDAIRADGPLPEERATHIARQVCRALREAHSLGVVHRDIKPGNIFLTQSHDEPDFVKVLDFGLVKDVNVKDEGLTQAGLFVGSPKYMAPEQIQGEGVDARTDIYALGIVMYEMVTGRVPFDRGSTVKTLIAHMNEAPPPLTTFNPNVAVSQLYEHVIARCLAKDPRDRFSSIDEVLLTLKSSSSALRTATITGISGQFAALTSTGTFSNTLSGSHSGPHVFMAGKTPSESFSNGGRVTIAQQNAKATARARILAAMGVATTAAIGAAVFLLVDRKPPTPAVEEFTAATSAPIAVAAAPAETKAPAPTTAGSTAATTASAGPTTVRIESTPDGALIRLEHAYGKKLCDATPCDVPRSDLPDGTSFGLFVVKSGFVSLRKVVETDGGSIKIELIPIPRGGGAAAPKPETPSTAPTTYKNDPYG